MINAAQMVEKLWMIPEGTIIQGYYQAGKESTERAIEEAKKAQHLHVDKQFFHGAYQGIRLNKQALPFMLIRNRCRYNMDDATAKDHYRAFNPELGKLLSLEIMDNKEYKEDVKHE